MVVSVCTLSVLQRVQHRNGVGMNLLCSIGPDTSHFVRCSWTNCHRRVGEVSSGAWNVNKVYTAHVLSTVRAHEKDGVSKELHTCSRYFEPFTRLIAR
jgi:hypothetical protein